MSNKEIENISEFFPEGSGDVSLQKKWESIFQSWIGTIDEKNLSLNLFELKLWIESLDAFFSSSYLEKQIFKYSAANLRNYDFYVNTFITVTGRMISHLKELDFKKDKYLLNFEEYIVESILEDYMIKSFPYLRDVYSPESWFYGLRIALQSLKNLAGEIAKSETVSYRVFSSIKKLYHKELITNPIIISLLRRKFIPKMDKIYQQDISNIMAEVKDKELKKNLGIFFVLAFRIMKINNFIELNVTKTRNIDITIPLIMALRRNLDDVQVFYDRYLADNLAAAVKKKADLEKMVEAIEDLKLEFKKIYEGELPQYFKEGEEKPSRRKVVKNIVIVSDLSIKELIETTARLFRPEISGSNIFENYISRKEKEVEVKERLNRLQERIDTYFSKKSNLSPADILFDINVFIETELNFLPFKDWNEFLNYYNNMVTINFSSEFDHNLKAFQDFIGNLINDLGK